MYKYILLMFLAFPCHAVLPPNIQADILHACQRLYVNKGSYCINKCTYYTRLYYEEAMICQRDNKNAPPSKKKTCNQRYFRDPAC